MKHFTLPYHVPPWGPMSTCSVHTGVHGSVGRPAELAAEVVAECSPPPGPGARWRGRTREGHRGAPGRLYAGTPAEVSHCSSTEPARVARYSTDMRMRIISLSG